MMSDRKKRHRSDESDDEEEDTIRDGRKQSDPHSHSTSSSRSRSDHHSRHNHRHERDDDRKCGERQIRSTAVDDDVSPKRRRSHSSSHREHGDRHGRRALAQQDDRSNRERDGRWGQIRERSSKFESVGAGGGGGAGPSDLSDEGLLSEAQRLLEGEAQQRQKAESDRVQGLHDRAERAYLKTLPGPKKGPRDPDGGVAAAAGATDRGNDRPRGGGGGDRGCFTCGEIGHFSRDCPKGGGGGGGGGGRRGRPQRRYDDSPRKEEWGKKEDEEGDGKDGSPAGPKEEPDFGLSGALAEGTEMMRNGVLLKWVPPPEAKPPKGDDIVAKMHIHRQPSYMFGKDRRVVDIPTDHPSCSKQHAVICHRRVESEDEFGVKSMKMKPYIIDLGSVNGTFVNGDKIESARYVELLEKDVLKFGFSSREYVLLHAQSADETP